MYPAKRWLKPAATSRLGYFGATSKKVENRVQLHIVRNKNALIRTAKFIYGTLQIAAPPHAQVEINRRLERCVQVTVTYKIGIPPLICLPHLSHSTLHLASQNIQFVYLVMQSVAIFVITKYACCLFGDMRTIEIERNINSKKVEHCVI